jgi:hypothetical protein
MTAVRLGVTETPSVDLGEVADRLRAILAAIDCGELDVPSAMRARIESAPTARGGEKMVPKHRPGRT